MNPVPSVVVFDAADLSAESAFWAGMLDGHVFDDEAFHCVNDSSGEWRIGVQHKQAVGLGARVSQEGDLDSDEGHQVYADPAGHPFCIGWGQSSREGLAGFVNEKLR
jgi:hypothetical protein